MASYGYTFRWPYNANEVFVTGTFDNWQKTVKLDRNGDVFEKEIFLPTISDGKVYYKFVVDGVWTTDRSSREESDGSNNINNVLLPEDFQRQSVSESAVIQAAAMSSVTPDSTTVALAAEVPKETDNPTISSAAPDSTTAELLKQSIREQSSSVPGSFPETPARASGEFSVNPIPASVGVGNPTLLRPGEKIPDASTITANTVESTVRTDKAAYEADASAAFQSGVVSRVGDDDLTLPTESKNLIPESSLPMGQPNLPDPGYMIQSAAPPATTAALAAGVPLESEKQQSSSEAPVPVDEIPSVVKDSMAEAHETPEAAASHDAVGQKRELENELHNKVDVSESGGTPAPTAAAASTESAPHGTGVPDSAGMPPRSASPTRPMVTTGVSEAEAPVVSKPREDVAPTEAADTTGPASGKGDSDRDQQAAQSQGNGNKAETESKKKKKNRASGLFSKLKEVFK